MKKYAITYGIIAGVTTFAMLSGFFLLPQLAQAAIAVDATTSSNKVTTTSFNVGTGSDLVLIVGIGRDTNSSPATVTYAGESMTKGVERGTGLGNFNVSLWYLVGPSTGTNDIVVSTSAQVLGAVVFSGSSGVGATNSNQCSGTSCSTVVSTTGTGSGYVVDIVGTQSTVGASTVGADQTQFASQNYSGSELGFMQMSYESYTSGGNPTMSWSGGSATRQLAAIEVIEGTQPVAGGSAASSLLMQTF